MTSKDSLSSKQTAQLATNDVFWVCDSNWYIVDTVKSAKTPSSQVVQVMLTANAGRLNSLHSLLYTELLAMVDRGGWDSGTCRKDRHRGKRC